MTPAELIEEIDGCLDLVRRMWLQAVAAKDHDNRRHYAEKINQLLDRRLVVMAKRDALPQ